MKLREYDYFKLADEDFNKTLDSENLYQVVTGLNGGIMRARNVENGTLILLDKGDVKRAIRVTDTNEIIRALSFCEELKTANGTIETENILIHNEKEPKEYKLPTTITTETVKERASAEPTKTDDVDMINKPPHYTHGMECIDEMILIFGVETVKAFCLCNAWKYRKRALYKNGEQDMEKSDWYINKLKELESME